MCVETIQQEAGQNHPSNGNQKDAEGVITGLPNPFALVEVDDGSDI